MSNDLAARLRAAVSALGGFELGGAVDLELSDLLLEAADRIARLEAPQRAIELASATGVSLERVLDVMNALGVTPDRRRADQEGYSGTFGWRSD